MRPFLVTVPWLRASFVALRRAGHGAAPPSPAHVGGRDDLEHGAHARG